MLSFGRRISCPKKRHVQHLQELLLAPGLEEPVEICFSWREADTQHSAGISQVSAPELGLVLWSRLTEGCKDTTWYPFSPNPPHFPHGAPPCGFA